MSVRLNVSTDAGEDANQSMRCIEDLEWTRSQLRYWLSSVDAGEFDAHEMSHILRQVQEHLEENIHELLKARSLLEKQVADLARALG